MIITASRVKKFANKIFLNMAVPLKKRLLQIANISNIEVYTSLNMLWSRGISYLFYLKNSTMYTSRYLKYLRFSEAFFSMGSPRLRKCYLQKCHMIRRVDHDALRETTRSSSPPPP